ncbi:hypothetical protein G9A89_020893 [Geosiphon pyriformis]|nr:hypothetical protein G9A89_020893 [Geosiphon pyriformis]
MGDSTHMAHKSSRLILIIQNTPTSNASLSCNASETFCLPAKQNEAEMETSLFLDSQSLTTAADYLEVCGMSFMIMSLFLVQAHWNEVVERITKERFMEIWEYNAYIAGFIFAFPTFPALRLILYFDDLLKKVIPQLVFSGLLFVLFLLGIRHHYRIRKIFSESTSLGLTNVKWKLSYFHDMNYILSISVLIYSLSCCSLALDALFDGKLFKSHEIITQIVVTHLNYSSLVGYVISLLIFHPSLSLLSATKAFIATPASPSPVHTIDIPTFKMVAAKPKKDASLPSNSSISLLPPAYTNKYEGSIGKSDTGDEKVENFKFKESTANLRPKGSKESLVPTNIKGINSYESLKPQYSWADTWRLKSPNSHKENVIITFNDSLPDQISFNDNESTISSEVGIAITTDDDDDRNM